MFEEYFTSLSIVVSPVQEVTTLRAVVLADSPVLNSINQDAPSSSNPSTQEQEQSPNISQGFEESPKTPTFHDDPHVDVRDREREGESVELTGTPTRLFLWIIEDDD
ncbi:hypothetical protein Tco_1394328 [Tanacetum coccineum]